MDEVYSLIALVIIGVVLFGVVLPWFGAKAG